MKKITLIVLIMISINVFSQEQKKIFEPEFEKFVLQCEKVGRTIISKSADIELRSWYEGIDSIEVNTEIKKLESDIDNSELNATYYLVMMNEIPLIYSFHFYNKETKTDFGQLFIRFKDRENNMVDNVKFVSKTEMEKINAESEKNSEMINIPLPPTPPAEKKKKEN